MCGKVSMLTKTSVIGTINSVWPSDCAPPMSIASAAIDTALRGATSAGEFHWSQRSRARAVPEHVGEDVEVVQ